MINDGLYNLNKINIYKDTRCSYSLWIVWVPVPPELVNAFYLPGPYGDTIWRSFDDAREFVIRVLKEK
jgi:hypothetical protein